jgi:hypothetical protein
VSFCWLAKEARTTQGEYRALVVNGHMSSPWRRLRPLPAAPLVVRRRYLLEVSCPLLAAPLIVRRRYLIAVLLPLRRCVSWVLNRGAHATARKAVP